MNDNQFNLFRDLLQKRCGIYFNAQNRSDLEDALAQVLRLTALDELTYYHFLENASTDEDLWRLLINRVTIGETYFFRNMPHFDILREHILPALIEQRRKLGLRILRLWSAGCSTGEEPYSLAMLLRELIDDLERWHIYILATDINEQSLEFAQHAVYTDNAFRLETPPEVRQKYFHYNGHHYMLRPEIRQMVYFDVLNLVENSYPEITQNMDMIFCRNVTIYFDKETTRQVVKRFHKALADGGWLFVGHAEPLASIYTDYETHNFPDATLYRKPFSTKQLSTKPIVHLPSLTKKETPLYTFEDIARMIAKGKTDDAREALRAYLQSSPRHVEALFLMAKLTADLGELESTHKFLDTIEAIDPLVPQAHYLRALAFEQGSAQDKLEKAKNALRRAIYADRNFVLAHYHMGELLFSEGNLAMAKRSWQMAYTMLVGKEPAQSVPYGDGATVGTLLYALKQRMGTDV